MVLKCALCKESINPDSQSDVQVNLNPETKREAWMHNSCYMQALGDLSHKEKEHYDDLWSEKYL